MRYLSSICILNTVYKEFYFRISKYTIGYPGEILYEAERRSEEEEEEEQKDEGRGGMRG